nr:hypothetical protein [uncultured Actinoplanes sp.]
MRDLGTAAPERPSPSAEVTAKPDLTHWLHTGLSLAAVIGLVVGTRVYWTEFALPRPGLAIVLTLGYGVMLVASVLVLCVRTTAALARLDIVVLGTAVVIKAVSLWPAITGDKEIRVDEGVLMDHAARTLAAGHNPYLAQWPDIDPARATRLMDGGAAFGLGYPPFGVEMGAAVERVAGSLTGVVVLSTLALLLTAVLVFFMAPVQLRPLATAGILGTGVLTAYAENAYPSLIALPLLCVAVWNWPSIGRGGRLGAFGIVRAVAIGLAACTHQLGWFLAVFLLAGLLLLRRGRPAVVLRYAGVALAAGLLVNLPFLVTDAAAWLHGVTEPLTQHAVPHGQGLMAISYHLIGGSGSLGFYGHASIALLLALLAAFALNLPWLGRAAVALPWILFYVALRSQDGYWVLTMPLWVAGLVTTTQADFAGAWRPRVPYRRWVTAALFVPALACLGIAIASPQPLRMRLTTPVVAGQQVRQLTVDVTNRSSKPVSPHFTVTDGVYLGQFWTVSSGPASLDPHATARYTLVPPQVWKPAPTGTALLRAVSDRPQTLSSLRILSPR